MAAGSLQVRIMLARGLFYILLLVFLLMLSVSVFLFFRWNIREDMEFYLKKGGIRYERKSTS